MILLMVLILQFRGQATTFEATQYSMTKTDLFTAVQVLELEFRNAGAVIRNPETTFTGGAIDTTSCFASSYATCSFTFWSRIDSTVVDSVLIRYDWKQVGTEALKNHDPGAVAVPTPVYEVERFINGTSYGPLLNRVTDFRILLFDADGDPITGNPKKTRRIDIRFTVPTHNTMKATGIETVDFETVFWPGNLTR